MYNYHLYRLWILLLLIFAFVPLVSRAQSPTPLHEVVSDEQLVITIQGRASSYYQPMIEMTLRRLSDEALDISVPTGLILQNEQSDFCRLVILRSEPSSIALPGKTEKIVQVYAYCLEPVVSGLKDFPSPQATYQVSDDFVSEDVLKTLQNIEDENKWDKLAAQIAVWRAATGKSLEQLEQETNLDLRNHEATVNRYLGNNATPTLPPSEETAIADSSPVSEENTNIEPTPDNNPTGKIDTRWLTYGLLGLVLLFFLLASGWVMGLYPFQLSGDSEATLPKPPPGVGNGGDVKKPLGGGNVSLFKSPDTEPIPARKSSSEQDSEKDNVPPAQEQNHYSTTTDTGDQKAISRAKGNKIFVEHDETEPIEGGASDDSFSDLQKVLILDVVEGEQKGAKYELQELNGVISRGWIDQVVLSQDRRVSAPHATLAIFHTQGKADRIRDLGSKNGTFLNEDVIEPYKWHELNEGDRLRFGQTTMRYAQAKQQLIYENSQRPPFSLEGNNRWLISRNKLQIVDFQTRDSTVSVPHVYIKTNGHLEVRDLSSHQSVRLRDQPIHGRRKRVFSGDIVQIGRDTEIRVTTIIRNLPSTIGEWTREELIAEGGMAQVYRVKHRSKEESYALKLPRLDRLSNEDGERYKTLFKHEVELSRSIQHRHIVEVVTNGEIPGTDIPYLVMQYIDGPSVNNIIEKSGQLSEENVAEIARQVGLALKRLHHQHQITHCDIKPNNLLLDQNGQVYLTDLGVATNIGQFVEWGTPRYLPKEVADKREQVGADTDIYSLGLTMFEMLTQQQLSIGSRLESDSNDTDVADQDPSSVKPNVLRRQEEGLLRQTAPNLNKIILKCINEERTQRYQQVEELLEAIEPYQNGADLKTLVQKTGR